MKQNPTWLFFLYLGWYWLWESPDKISKSGYYTFEWLKMVSEVRFLRFWGVFYIEKCFGNSVSVIRSAIFKISELARYRSKMKNLHLKGNQHFISTVEIKQGGLSWKMVNLSFCAVPLEW